MPPPPAPSSDLVSDARYYAEVHGLLHTPSDLQSPLLTHAPFALYPAPIPRSLYNTANDLTAPLSKLILAISTHPTYLPSRLTSTAKADEFTRRLLDIFNEVQNEKREAPRVLMVLNRYDYFIHQSPEKDKGDVELKQVEMNTISASFASLSGITSDMHRYLAQWHKGYNDDGELMVNHPVVGIVKGLVKAHKCYVDVYGGGEEGVETRTMMVVNPVERNRVDQEGARLMMKDYGMNMFRVTMREVSSDGKVGKDGALYFRGFRVSVVYIRCGYGPEEYLSEKEWEARALIEKSNAVKCPTVAMQLAGTKRVQQALTDEGEVEMLIKESKQVERIRKCFAKQWDLNESSVAMAKKTPAGFVLKPQREGGANNLYGMELKNALDKMSKDDWNGYTLMERLYPVSHKNALVRRGTAEEDEVVSELGIYGVLISMDGKVVENYSPGTLVRTKFAKVEDGGVVAGVAVLDSARILDDT